MVIVLSYLFSIGKFTLIVKLYLFKNKNEIPL